jgi:uncharacterized membrane protein YfcA
MTLAPDDLVLLAIVLVSYSVGSALGFGSSVLALTCGAFFYPLDRLLLVAAPLNVAVSGYLAVRYRRETEWRTLWRRILPYAGAGIPVGLLLFHLGQSPASKLVFGVFVAVLAAAQLGIARPARPRAPLAPPLGNALLFGGGVVHGLFGTGGPLIVYVVGRDIPDKGAFRATLATMWVPLNVALVVDYALAGLYGATAVKLVGLALLPVIAATWLGERVHERLDPERFLRAVWAFLLLGGALVAARAAMAL